MTGVPCSWTATVCSSCPGVSSGTTGRQTAVVPSSYREAMPRSTTRASIQLRSLWLRRLHLYATGRYHNSQWLTFSNGSSGIGGALAILSQTHFSISHSEITRCRSDVMGGGVYVRRISFTAHNLVVHDSNSSKGGALACENSRNLTLDGGVISGNSASSNGGGVYIDTCRTTIDQYNFRGNHANIYGGGIYVTSGQVSMHNTVADDNEAGEMGGFLLVVGDSRFHHFGRYFTELFAYSKLQRMRNRYRSYLSAINIELGQNRAKTGSNIAVVNGSFATLEKLHRPHIPPGVICPLTVRGQSRMDVVSLFHTNHSAQTQNEATPLNTTTAIDVNTTATVDIDDDGIDKHHFRFDEDPIDARRSKYPNDDSRYWRNSRYEPEKNAKKTKNQDIHVCRDGTSILVGNITSGQFPNLFIAARNSSCGKVMFSQACVNNSLHRWVFAPGTGGIQPSGRHPPGQTPLRQTPPQADTTWANAPFRQTTTLP